MVLGLPWSAKMAFFFQGHRILYQVREIQTSTSESVKSRGISFLSIHKVCKEFPFLVKVMSFIFKNYEGIDFCRFIVGFNSKGLVIGRVNW